MNHSKSGQKTDAQKMDIEEKLEELKDILFLDTNYEINDDDDQLLVDNGSNEAKYVEAILSQEKVICKIFDPSYLKEDQTQDPTDKKSQAWYRQLMLFRELYFLIKLKHPTIVDLKGINIFNKEINYCYDMPFCDDDEKKEANPTFFLEYLDNKSLQFIIDKKIKLPPVNRQIIMIGLSAAIRFIHGHDVLHRGLNPLTIWLDSNFYPKIFDFSSSRSDDSPFDQISKTVLNVGSSFYISPEASQQSNTDYSKPVDIFSLGGLLYYLITGYTPFKHPKDENCKKGTYIVRKRFLDGTDFPFIPKDMPKEFIDLLKRCWSHNPSERPSAEEVYYLLSQEEKYLLKDIKPEDIPKIKSYIEMIEEFEKNHRPNKLSICKASEDVHIPLILTIPKTKKNIKPEQQEQLLSRIVLSHFSYLDHASHIELFNEMAENKSIYKSDYILQVINYVNDYIKMNREYKSEFEFLQKVFGEKVFLRHDVVMIKENFLNRSITTANIPHWVTTICTRAFSDFPNLMRVNIPSSVVSIAEEAFSKCPKLKIINIPSSIKGGNLGKCAFRGCTSLEKMILPPFLTEIKDGTFKGCTALKKVELNKGLEVIGEEAFMECKSLHHIIVPGTVKLIKDKAFQKSSLKKIYFHNQRPTCGKKSISFFVSKDTI